MRIYFEDGALWSGVACDRRINGNDGISECLKTLDLLRMNEIDTGTKYTVYTNFPLALSNKYAWDNEGKRPDIYIRDANRKWLNIVCFTDKEIRPAHNILKMYVAGRFASQMRGC